MKPKCEKDLECMNIKELQTYLRNHWKKPKVTAPNKSELLSRAKLYFKNYPDDFEIDQVNTISEELDELSAKRVIFNEEHFLCSTCDKISTKGATVCCGTNTVGIKKLLKFRDISSFGKNYPDIPQNFNAEVITNFLQEAPIKDGDELINAGTEKSHFKGDDLYFSKHIQYAAVAELDAITLKRDTLNNDIYWNDLLIFQANVKATYKKELR